MTTYDFDAIVIGSGVSGGWAAKELTEKGMKVLMLDRGRMVEHKKDYITEGMGPWKLPYRGTLPPTEVARDHFLGKWGGAASTDRTHFYNNDRLNPFDYENSRPFRWVRRIKRGRDFQDFDFGMALATIDEIKLHGRPLMPYERMADKMLGRMRRVLGVAD